MNTFERLNEVYLLSTSKTFSRWYTLLYPLRIVTGEENSKVKRIKVTSKRLILRRLRESDVLYSGVKILMCKTRKRRETLGENQKKMKKKEKTNKMLSIGNG